MSNTFSIKRLWLVYKWQLMSNPKSALFLVLTFIGIPLLLCSLCVMGMFGPENDIHVRFMNVVDIMIGVYFGFSIALSVISARVLDEKKNRMTILTLPASNEEKVVGMWLYGSLSVMAATFLSMAFGTFLFLDYGMPLMTSHDGGEFFRLMEEKGWFSNAYIIRYIYMYFETLVIQTMIYFGWIMSIGNFLKRILLLVGGACLLGIAYLEIYFYHSTVFDADEIYTFVIDLPMTLVCMYLSYRRFCKIPV